MGRRGVPQWGHDSILSHFGPFLHLVGSWLAPVGLGLNIHDPIPFLTL